MTFSKLGKAIKDGTFTDEFVNLYKVARLEGTYILGRPKTGKTGLIENLIFEDIKQDIGLCLLDPHGDLTNTVLSRIDAKTAQKVLLLDIANPQFCLNPLACSDKTDEIAVQYTLSQVLHIFEKTYKISLETPQMYDYLYNCVYTLIVNPDTTILDIQKLLTDQVFRKQMLLNMHDTTVLTFWRDYEEMGKDRYGKLEQLKERKAILNKLNDFSHAPLSTILGKTHSILDMKAIMDAGKILLVKLDERLEKPTSLLGSIIIAQILNAGYSRKEGQRKQFHLYIDECQRFGTLEDVGTLIAEL